MQVAIIIFLKMQVATIIFLEKEFLYNHLILQEIGIMKSLIVKKYKTLSILIINNNMKNFYIKQINEKIKNLIY